MSTNPDMKDLLNKLTDTVTEKKDAVKGTLKATSTPFHFAVIGASIGLTGGVSFQFLLKE